MTQILSATVSNLSLCSSTTHFSLRKARRLATSEKRASVLFATRSGWIPLTIAATAPRLKKLQGGPRGLVVTSEMKPLVDYLRAVRDGPQRTRTWHITYPSTVSARSASTRRHAPRYQKAGSATQACRRQLADCERVRTRELALPCISADWLVLRSRGNNGSQHGFSPRYGLKVANNGAPIQRRNFSRLPEALEATFDIRTSMVTRSLP